MLEEVSPKGAFQRRIGNEDSILTSADALSHVLDGFELQVTSWQSRAFCLEEVGLGKACDDEPKMALAALSAARASPEDRWQASSAVA